MFVVTSLFAQDWVRQGEEDTSLFTFFFIPVVVAAKSDFTKASSSSFDGVSDIGIKPFLPGLLVLLNNLDWSRSADVPMVVSAQIPGQRDAPVVHRISVHSRVFSCGVQVKLVDVIHHLKIDFVSILSLIAPEFKRSVE